MSHSTSTDNHHAQNGSQPPSMARKLTTKILKQVLAFSYGLFNWFLYLGIAIGRGTFFQRFNAQEQMQIAIARDKLWNLSKQPIPGYYHAFHASRKGRKLHYITNRSANSPATDDLVIFIHGFPDSSMLWRYVLKEPVIPHDSATIVCVDLPGYGGSDSLEKYDSVVLDALVEFVVAMREKYTEKQEESPDRNTLIVGHDWGCVVAFRLSIDAPCLANRFILINGLHYDLTWNNVDRTIQSSKKIFKQFRNAPWQNLGCLFKAYYTLKPVLVQLLLSGYVFAFNLPAVFVKILTTKGNFALIRGALRAEHGRRTGGKDVLEAFASTIGPSESECASATASSERYGPSVMSRAKDPAEAMYNTTAYYRDGLFGNTWVKSLETLADLHHLDNYQSPSSTSSPYRRRSSSSASSALFSDWNKGSVRAPATLLWGDDDLALSKAICLDGISDYLAKESEVIILPRTGHWGPVENESRAVIAKLVSLFTGARTTGPGYVFKSVETMYQGSTLMCKR